MKSPPAACGQDGTPGRVACGPAAKPGLHAGATHVPRRIRGSRSTTWLSPRGRGIWQTHTRSGWRFSEN